MFKSSSLRERMLYIMEQFSKKLEQIAQMDDPGMQEVLSKLKKLYGTIQYDNSALQHFFDAIVEEYQAKIQNSDKIIDTLATKIADLSITNYENDKEKQSLQKQARQYRVEISDLSKQIEKLQHALQRDREVAKINVEDVNIKLSPELFSRVVNFVAINQDNFVEAQQLYKDLLACSDKFTKAIQNDNESTNNSPPEDNSSISQSDSDSSHQSNIPKSNKKGGYSRPAHDLISELIQNRRKKYKNSEQFNEAFDDLISVLRLFD